MRSPAPIPTGAIEAAAALHARIAAWRRSDEAMLALRSGVPGFSAAETLLKAATVNALYYTNVFAIVRVSEHFASELARSDLGSAGPELVERLANVPKGGSERKPVRRTSLAAKFAHFFIDEDRFPIYDRYAVRMVAKHLGRSITSVEAPYSAFAAAFDGLAASIGLERERRRLDRYLWVQGQYEDWKAGGKTISSDLRPVFERGEWPVA
jgi:hypothetical protein